MTISRRNFLTLSLTGIPVATMAMPTFQDHKWTAEADVLVIGAGGAGLSAACAAVDLKLSSLILEKTGFPGGSSLLCNANYAVGGTDEQKKKNIQDSPKLFAADMVALGGGFAKPDVVEVFSRAALVQYNFMTKALKTFPDNIAKAAGMSVPRGHIFNAPDVIDKMLKYAKQGGAKIETNTRAIRLICNKDCTRIIGVEAERNGEKKYFKGKYGVLLASGGFARSPALLKRYAPNLHDIEILSAVGNTGDGLLMAQAYGAAASDMNFINATYGAKPGIKSVQELASIYTSGAIAVTKEGKRFVNESLPYLKLSEESLNLRDPVTYLIFDENILKEACKSSPQRKTLWTPILNGKLPEGVTKAANLADLGKQSGISPENLEKTIKQYNSDVAKGKDSVFGREHLSGSIGQLVPIEKGPFYSFPVTSVLFGTFCGVEINPEMEVLDVFGKVIPGLYAAGEVTGGIHGANYMSGSGYSKALALGRYAVKVIAETK